MSVHHLQDLADPLLEPYRDLKDRELARRGERFIAEGEHVVRRLLASDHAIESVLLSRRREAALAPLVPGDVPVYVLDDAQIAQVMGFKFHSGVIACGRRKAAVTLASLAAPPGPRLLVICPEVINHENLGSLIRIAAAFGVDAFVLGERSCDPYWRRAIRVSMGTVFSMNIIRSSDLAADLRMLRERWDVKLVATVLDDDAAALETVARPERLGLLLGSEAQGLAPHWTALCDQQVTIPMQLGTDSLNITIAAAVFLYHFTRVRPGS